MNVMSQATSLTPHEGGDDFTPQAKVRLEIEHLKADNKKLLLENEKLALELKRLQTPPDWASRLKQLLPLVTAMLAVAGFWFGIWQYFRSEDARQADEKKAAAALAAQEKQAAEERLEQQKQADINFQRNLTRDTARQLWEKMLVLYIEAAEKAAVIATTEDDGVRREAEKRFWVLYWGPLAAVEDLRVEPDSRADSPQDQPDVALAMVNFGREIEKDVKDRNPGTLRTLSLELARTVRKAIARGFGVHATSLEDVPKQKP
jgi:hypothetical protein